jgi:prevent-host-death family protein
MHVSTLGDMESESVERSAREVREHLADVINDAVRGQTTYITSRGRRVAAIVPLAIAERADVAAES